MISFKVTCEWDDEVSLWYVAESDVPGLSAEAPTVEKMQELLKVRIPELVLLNIPDFADRSGSRRIPYDMVTRRHQDLSFAAA